MAGIGFELRKILSKDSYTSTMRAYLYAGLISSGPWVLSIISVMLIGVLSLGAVLPETLIGQFLVTVTYLMATSLILTGGLQLFFTRFVSDRLFERRLDLILPNLVGILLLVTIVSGLLAICVLGLLFDQSFSYRLLVMANFVVLCNLWLVIIFLSGMKAYNRILGVMFLGYSLMVASAYLLRFLNIDGLLLGLLIGHSSLLFIFLFDILREYPAERLVRLLPVQSLLPGHARVTLGPEDAGRFLSGVRRRGDWPDQAQVAVYGPPAADGSEVLLGSAHVAGGELIPGRLLSPIEIQQIQETSPEPTP